MNPAAVIANCDMQGCSCIQEWDSSDLEYAECPEGWGSLTLSDSHGELQQHWVCPAHLGLVWRLLASPPEALASGTDNSFGGTTRPDAPSSADPADTATQVKTDSSLVSLSGLPHVAAGPRWADTREGHRLTQAECSTAATAVRMGSLFIVLEDQSQWGFEGGGFMCLDGEPSEKTRAVMMRWAMQIAELRKNLVAVPTTREGSVECPRCQVRYSPPDADCPGCAERRLRPRATGDCDDLAPIRAADDRAWCLTCKRYHSFRLRSFLLFGCVRGVCPDGD